MENKEYINIKITDLREIMNNSNRIKELIDTGLSTFTELEDAEKTKLIFNILEHLNGYNNNIKNISSKYLDSCK